MSKELTISDDTFIEEYRPIKNHIVDDAPWDGCMFETYGEELEYIRELCHVSPRKIWTILDCDGKTIEVSGVIVHCYV